MYFCCEGTAFVFRKVVKGIGSEILAGILFSDGDELPMSLQTGPPFPGTATVASLCPKWIHSCHFGKGQLGFSLEPMGGHLYQDSCNEGLGTSGHCNKGREVTGVVCFEGIGEALEG